MDKIKKEKKVINKEEKKTKKKVIRKVKPKEEKVVREKSNISFNLLEVILIILITGVTISVCSGVIVYTNYSKIAKEYDDKEDAALAEFETTYKHILSSYVDDINEDKLVDAAIEGMFNYLEDAHTSYLDKTETDTLQERLNGKYVGLGVEIAEDENNNVYVIRVFENSPAEVAGIQSEDIILSVNDESIQNKTAAYVASLIKEKNQIFNIVIERNGEKKNFTVSTDTVEIPSIETEIYDKTGYIKIDIFSANTSTQFEQKLKALENQGINNLIIDVRNNTGGYLSSAYEIADLFIKKGKIVYELKDKDGKIEAFNAKKETSRSYKVNVLINGTSASASEILSGALKYSYGATLIGTKTFGKGTVQETENLNTGSMIKYTTAHWLMPNGECIDKIGITPDVKIEDDLETDEDEQLLEALKVINN